MITQPLTNEDHIELAEHIEEVAAATFSSERVRNAAASVAGFDEVAWKQLVELGWTQAGDPEDEDLGPLVQCIVHRELGARLAPSPYLSSVGFTALALRLLGGTPESGALLEQIGAGAVSAALVNGRRGWSRSEEPAVRAERAGEAWKLSGEVPLCLDGSRADALVVLAGVEDGWGLFRVDPEAEGVSREAVPVVDRTRSFGKVGLAGVEGQPLNAEPVTDAQVDGLVDQLAVVLSAEMVGAAIACMRQTLEYLTTRHQFGRPIGSFQALKHRCSDMAVDLTMIHETLFAAAQALADGDAESLRMMAPLLLARSGEVFKHTTEEGIQLHGGVGFTDEFDVGLYYKRSLVDLELLATPVDAYRRLTQIRQEVER